MQPVKGFDATWLYLETDKTPMHIGGFQLFRLPDDMRKQGPSAFADAVHKQIEARLHLVPAFRRRLSFTPMDMDHPVWVEDKQFDLSNHIIRHVVGPDAPVSEAEALAVAIHAEPLDRAHPLWEYHVIEGLEGGRAAIYAKLHQAVVDGDAGQSYMQILCDMSPNPETALATIDGLQDDWEGEEDPGFLSAVTRVAQNLLEQPGRTARALPSIARAALRVGRAAVQRTEQFARFVGPQSIFNQPVSDQRSWARTGLDLPRLKMLADDAEVTLTDIVLASVGGALRSYLLERDALPEKSLTALVPYSPRDPQDGTVSDRLSMMLAALGTDQPDSLKRLEAIAIDTEVARDTFQPDEGAPFDHYSILGAPAVMRGLVGAYGRLELAGRHRPILGNVIVSNIAGVAKPLYVAGAEMVGNWPLALLLPGQALNIAAQSYQNRLFISVTGCLDALDDPASILAHLDDEIIALEKAIKSRSHDQSRMESSSAA